MSRNVMYTSFKLLRAGFVGGQVPGRKTVPRGELWEALISREDEKSNIQIPIDEIREGASRTGVIWNKDPMGTCGHQSQVTLGRCGPISYHAKQDQLPPHAC